MRDQPKRYPSIPNAFEMTGKKGKYIAQSHLASPEIASLASLPWMCYEKINGMNIKVDLQAKGRYLGHASIRGRNEDSIIPTALSRMLHETFTANALRKVFTGDVHATLYGEGVGPCIGKHAARYGEENFILFDVNVNGWWLKQHDVGFSVDRVAEALGIERAPLATVGTLYNAAYWVLDQPSSAYGNFIPEGLVCRPPEQLFDRHQRRIICKIKYLNFTPGHRADPGLFLVPQATIN